MGDNELLDSVSPSDVDLSPLIDKLEELIVLQRDNLKVQNELKEYFVPTDEELKALEEQDKKELEEQNKLDLEEQKQLELEEQERLDYESELLERQLSFEETVVGLLSDIKLNSGSNNEISAISSSSNYILLLVVVALVFFGLMYKAIRFFIYK